MTRIRELRNILLKLFLKGLFVVRAILIWYGNVAGQMKAIHAISQIEQLVKLALENTDIQTKGTPRSVRLPDELDENINKAMAALQCDRTEIVVACVRKAFTEVVSEMIATRRQAVAGWLEGTSADMPKTDVKRNRTNRKSGPTN